jgi:predicted porin
LIASNGNHQDYSATLSALYLLDTRTTVGLNYQYGQDVFVDAGPNNGLNAVSHTLYLSVVRRFNPRLSLSLNGGYTVRDSQDGTQSTSPSAYGSLVYNFGPASAITLTLAQSLNEATLGVNRQFSAQQNTSFVVQISHRLTTRLRAIGDITYVYGSFTQPLGATATTTGPIPVGGFGNPTPVGPPPGSTVSPNDQALTGHLGLNYAFRDWVSAVLDYSYTDLVSSDVLLIQPYTRNQINAGISLTY